jgi:hypothetical protein
MTAGTRWIHSGRALGQAAAATLAVLVLLGTGCSGASEANAAERGRLEGSLATWKQLVQAQGDTYSYVVPTSSFTGWVTRTGLQVEAGVVTYRRYESSTVGPTGTTLLPATLQWEERAAEVGSHQAGAAPSTIDALYQRCANQVLTQSPDTNVITLGLDDRSLLATCTFRPKNCQDDCAMGVVITELQFGKKD